MVQYFVPEQDWYGNLVVYSVRKGDLSNVVRFYFIYKLNFLMWKKKIC